MHGPAISPANRSRSAHPVAVFEISSRPATSGGSNP